MQDAIITARVGRFRDYVQISLDDGKTLYIKPQDANALAKALLDCQNDIKNHPNFCNSQVINKEIYLQGKVS